MCATASVATRRVEEARGRARSAVGVLSDANSPPRAMRSGGEERTLAKGDVGLFAAGQEETQAVFVQNCGVLRAAGVIKPPLSIEPMTKSRATQNALKSEKTRKLHPVYPIF